MVMSETAKTSSSSPGVQGPLRIATAADVNAITPLINAAFVVERPILDNDRIDAASVRDFMTRGEFLLLEDATGKLIACVFLESGQDARCYLGLLSVEPSQQGRGLGRQLNAAAEEFARNAGCRTMDLRIVSPRAESLLPVYKHLGYSEAGTAPFPADVSAKVPCHYLLMTKSLL